MYQKRLTRFSPGCIVFLIDRSDSMKRPWRPGSSMTLAEGAASALNRILDNLTVFASTGTGRVRHYVDIGVFGYGRMQNTGGEGVESALSGALVGRSLVSLPELADNPLREQEEPSPDAGAPPVQVPVWVDPLYGHRTPMCEAIAVAGSYLHSWIGEHPNSFPPVVINITDGQWTDRYGGASLTDWAQRLRMLETEDGPTLLYNVFLSPGEQQPQRFPASADGLPEPGPEMFDISSVLPDSIADNARKLGIPVPENGRAFCFNADFVALQEFFRVGTLPATIHAG